MKRLSDALGSFTISKRHVSTSVGTDFSYLAVIEAPSKKGGAPSLHYGMVFLDTGADMNLISSQFAKKLDLEIRQSRKGPEQIIDLPGSPQVPILGTVRCRWTIRPSKSKSGIRVSVPREYVESEFEVVSSALPFDMIIGSETILENGISQKRARGFYAFRRTLSKVNEVAMTQADRDRPDEPSGIRMWQLQNFKKCEC